MRYWFTLAVMSLVPTMAVRAQETAPAPEPAAAASVAQAPAPQSPADSKPPKAEAAAKKPVPAGVAPADAAAPAKVEEHAQPAAGEGTRKPDQQLPQAAREFYRALVNRDAETLSALCRPPFYFEGKAAQTGEEIKRRWSSFLQGKGLSTAHLYGIDVFTPEEMAARHGKAPEKLAEWPLRGAMLSVGNVEGHAVIVLWRRGTQGWQAAAVHD